MAKEIKYKGRFLSFVDDNSWEYVERNNCSDVAVIFAINEKDEVILVEQFRKAIGKNLIEFPAGLVGDSGSEEEIEEAANRELEEEAGYRAGKMDVITRGPTSAGLTSETVTILMADNLKKVSDGGGVESENITVHEIPLESVDQWLKDKEASGVMIDLKVYAGLYMIHQKKKNS